jgi:hypothetical protein
MNYEFGRPGGGHPLYLVILCPTDYYVLTVLINTYDVLTYNLLTVLLV